jgi:hypothetical protein
MSVYILNVPFAIENVFPFLLSLAKCTEREKRARENPQFQICIRSASPFGQETSMRQYNGAVMISP